MNGLVSARQLLVVGHRRPSSLLVSSTLLSRRPSGSPLTVTAMGRPISTGYPHVEQYRPRFDPQRPMYKRQPEVPMLPVPALKETLDKYLATVRPLCKTDAEWQHTQRAVKEFAESDQAKVLQQRLEQRKDVMASEGKSWFIDWWNDYAYMSYRDPVVINVSYFFQYRDDRRRVTQSRRAASLVAGALEFRDAVVQQTLAPDMAGSGEKAYPLCMHQYQFMYNSCRVPVVPSDVTNTYDPNAHRHIVVIRKGKIFTVDVAGKGGAWLNESELEAAFEAVKASADADGFASFPVGALTSENRDKWAESHKRLWEYSAGNQESLKKIESAILAVCLDDTAPVTRDEVGRALWHGDGKNRWYDKTMQFIVFENGKAGFLGEHAMMDATPLFRMSEFVCGRAERTAPRVEPVEKRVVPQQLPFHFPESFPTYIQSAINRFEADVARHDHKVLAYEGFGKSTIKKYAVSPDSFMQMAIQLANFKMFGEPRATYESSQTKRFAWGRTEVCRSVSVESKEWTEMMTQPEVSPLKKVELLRKAIASHSKYIAGAANGHGVDRHLLGLKMSLKSGEPMPAIFTDPMNKRSSHWNISTSQVSSEYFDGWGWGEVVPDGFGIAYMIKNQSLHFNVAALKGGPGYEAGPGSWRGKGQGEVNACQRLVHLLQESIGEMRAVFEEELKTKPAATTAAAKL